MNKEQLKALEKLCRIRLSDSEEEALVKNLDKILKAVSELSEVNTDGVEACSHVIEGVTAPLREDEPEELLPHQEFIAAAPQHVGGMVRVPPVIQE